MDQLSFLQAIMLGAIQGATEFLPVSSSGHLVIMQQLIDWKAAENIQIAFDLTLHIGTLLAVIAAFYKDILNIILGRDWQTVSALLVATMPAVIVVLTVGRFIERVFLSIPVVSIAWLFTGTLLYLSKFAGKPTRNKNINIWQAAIIGCAQALAIIPGISRSGTTITTALLLKLDRQLAAKFSFLMAAIVILGGALFDMKNIKELINIEWTAVAVAFITSLVVGYTCVKWMLRLVVAGRLSAFSYYCWTLGFISLAAYLF